MPGSRRAGAPQTLAVIASGLLIIACSSAVTDAAIKPREPASAPGLRASRRGVSIGEWLDDGAPADQSRPTSFPIHDPGLARRRGRCDE